MKIYTRKGDDGRTKLYGGRRLSKSSLRIEAYGEVDELNAVIGMAASRLEDTSIGELLQKVQNDLHLACSDLANPDLKKKTHRITGAHVGDLEKQCDELESILPPLKEFILQGGTPAGSQLHFARTVARRAERHVVRLAEEESINTEVIRYLNRLSDLLFLMARWINHEAGVSEKHPDLG